MTETRNRMIPFIPKLACEIGVKESILLSQIHFWLRRSKNIRDSKVWVYKTYDEWQEEVCCFSYNSIRRALETLEQLGLVQSKEYNRLRRDRTKWYTIDYNHPILVKLGIAWKCPKILNDTSDQNGHSNCPKRAVPSAQNGHSQMPKKGSSYQYMTQRDEQQKITIKPDENSAAYRHGYKQHKSEENWIASRSEQEKEQIEKFIKQTMLKRKETIHDRLAYRARLIRNIWEGTQKDFKLISDDKYLDLAVRHYGPPDLETLKCCTPPSDWIKVKAEFESAQPVSVTSGVSTGPPELSGPGTK